MALAADSNSRGRPKIEGLLAAIGALALLGAAWLALDAPTRLEIGRRLASASGPAAAERALVTAAIDGDTVLLADGRTVRLLGIDAPETVNPNLEHAQALGAAASERMHQLVDGQAVALEADVTDADHYGRILRHVWLGGQLVGQTLVAEGLARAYALPPDLRHRDRLSDAEDRARRAGIGIWGLPRPTPLAIFAGPGE